MLNFSVYIYFFWIPILTKYEFDRFFHFFELHFPIRAIDYQLYNIIISKSRCMSPKYGYFSLIRFRIYLGGVSVTQKN